MSDVGVFPGIRDGISEETARKVIEMMIASGTLTGTVDDVLASGFRPWNAAGRLRCAMPEMATGGQCKWPMKDVDLGYTMTLGGLTSAQITEAAQHVCDAWNAVCGINLTVNVTQPNNSNIYAQAGRIDGSSGTLAYSYLPCNASQNTQLAQLFDNAEAWTLNWLKETWTHEVGHGIGLEHSNDKSAIMYPYSHGGGLLLPQTDDIQKAVSRYGPPVAQPTPPTPVPPPPGELTVGGIIVINGHSYKFVLVPNE